MAKARRQNHQATAKAAPLAAQVVAGLLSEAAHHRAAGRYGPASVIYERLERSNPQEPDPPFFMALIKLEQGRPAPALARLTPLTRRFPSEPQVWLAFAQALRDLGRWEESIAPSRRALALDPANIEARFALVNALEVAGYLDEALTELRTVLADPSMRLAALETLARISPASVSPTDLADMIAAAHDAGADTDRRITLYYAVGPLLERQGLFEEAFEAFSAGARLKRSILTGDMPTAQRPPPRPGVRALHPAAAEQALIGEAAFMKSLFTPDFIAAQAGLGSDVQTPIFVVGMPRSGSSLIEQLLSSHAKVQGLGETLAFPIAVDGQFPLNSTAPHGPDHYRGLADAYLAAMRDCGWTNATRFVDKLLGNYIYIGMIHLVFPKATILHAVRDPVDICLSAFRQPFGSANELSYDLAEVGRWYVLYRQMMEHWEAVLPGRVIDVDHEALVADPDARIRRLVTEACGLSWDPACLEFYRTKRPVRTASVAQVRQPIFTTSIQRWRRYEKHLGPLLDVLGPYAARST